MSCFGYKGEKKKILGPTQDRTFSVPGLVVGAIEGAGSCSTLCVAQLNLRNINTVERAEVMPFVITGAALGFGLELMVQSRLAAWAIHKLQTYGYCGGATKVSSISAINHKVAIGVEAGWESIDGGSFTLNTVGPACVMLKHSSNIGFWGWLATGGSVIYIIIARGFVGECEKARFYAVYMEEGRPSVFIDGDESLSRPLISIEDGANEVGVPLALMGPYRGEDRYIPVRSSMWGNFDPPGGEVVGNYTVKESPPALVTSSRPGPRPNVT